jgi:hypothetical protein
MQTRIQCPHTSSDKDSGGNAGKTYAHTLAVVVHNSRFASSVTTNCPFNQTISNEQRVGLD